MSVLGNKYECVECGVKFYDLGRSQAVCPSCGTDQNEVPRTEDDKETSTSNPKKSTKVAKDEAPAKSDDLDDEEDSESEEDLDEEDLEDLDEELDADFDDEDEDEDEDED